MHSSMREANFQALLSDDNEMHSHVSDLVYERTTGLP